MYNFDITLTEGDLLLFRILYHLPFLHYFKFLIFVSMYFILLYFKVRMVYFILYVLKNYIFGIKIVPRFDKLYRFQKIIIMYLLLACIS